MNRIKILVPLIIVSVFFCFTTTAYAVIPQLLGPLSALISIIPQILAFVGIAVVTSIVFARDTTKMLFYRLRNFVFANKIGSLVSILVLIILAVLTFQFVDRNVKDTPPITIEPEKSKTELVTNTQSWPTFRGNDDRTGHLDDLSGPLTNNINWIFKSKEAKAVELSSSPAIIGNRLYIGATHGSIFSVSGATYCIDIETNKLVWRHDSDIPIISSPAVVAGRVYIGEGYHYDTGCRLRCLDANTGDPIWSFKTASHVESTPSIVQGRLYFTAGGDGVYCLDALAGEEIWHFPAVHADMAPLVKDGKVYFGTGYGEYRTYAVDAMTGDEIWSKPAPYPVWGSPSSYNNIIYFGLGRGNFSESAPIPKGSVIALNMETGDTVWEYEVGDAVMSAICVRNEQVIFGSRDGHVYNLSALHGELNWRTNLNAVVASSPAVTEESVYAATYEGRIFSLDVSKGDLEWVYDSNSVSNGLKFISSPAIANGNLYIGSSGRYVFCLGGDKAGSFENR